MLGKCYLTVVETLEIYDHIANRIYLNRIIGSLIGFGLTRPGIEPEFIGSAADTLSTTTDR